MTNKPHLMDTKENVTQPIPKKYHTQGKTKVQYKSITTNNIKIYSTKHSNEPVVHSYNNIVMLF